jgi:hypothetical protein
MNKSKNPRAGVRGLIAAIVGSVAGIGAAAVGVAGIGEPAWGLLLWGVPIGVAVGAAVGVSVWLLVRLVLVSDRRRNHSVFVVCVAGMAGALLAGIITFVSFASSGAAVALPVTGAVCVLAVAGAVAEYRCAHVEAIRFAAANESRGVV